MSPTIITKHGIGDHVRILAIDMACRALPRGRIDGIQFDIEGVKYHVITEAVGGVMTGPITDSHAMPAFKLEY